MLLVNIQKFVLAELSHIFGAFKLGEPLTRIALFVLLDSRILVYHINFGARTLQLGNDIFVVLLHFLRQAVALILIQTFKVWAGAADFRDAVGNLFLELPHIFIDQLLILSINVFEMLVETVDIFVFQLFDHFAVLVDVGLQLRQIRFLNRIHCVADVFDLTIRLS